MKKLRIIVIDSDITYTSNVCKALSESRNIEIAGIEYDGIRGIEHIRRANPDVVLTDIQLPGIDGISLLRETRLMKHPPVVIICTRFYSDFCIDNAQHNGAAYILYKPIDFHALPELVSRCYESVSGSAYRQKQIALQREIKVDEAYKVRSILFDLGMPVRFVGSMYLVESVLLASENRMLMGNLSKGLYAEMAAKLNTTPAGIERSLRNVISATYQRGDLSRIFDHRPSNKQFLLYLIHRLNDTPSNNV